MTVPVMQNQAGAWHDRGRLPTLSTDGYQYIRRIVNVDEIASRPWCDRIHALGSFWVDDPPRDAAASQIAKFFKENPSRPEWPALAEGYADLIATRIAGTQLDAITPRPGIGGDDAEIRHDLSILCEMLSTRLNLPIIYPSAVAPRGSPCATSRTSAAPRSSATASTSSSPTCRLCSIPPPSSLIPHPSSFWLNDILCLGASMHVYAAALKRACGAQRVVGMNIAATRFRGRQRRLGRCPPRPGSPAGSQRAPHPGVPSGAFDPAGCGMALPSRSPLRADVPHPNNSDPRASSASAATSPAPNAPHRPHPLVDPPLLALLGPSFPHFNNS